LLNRHVEAHKRAMYAAGTVAAAVINSNPYRSGEPVSALDFVPNYEPRTDEEMIESMANLFGSGPGMPN